MNRITSLNIFVVFFLEILFLCVVLASCGDFDCNQSNDKIEAKYFSQTKNIKHLHTDLLIFTNVITFFDIFV